MDVNAIDTVKTNHIRELARKGMRDDGRELLKFRNIKITKGLLENAEGSAQVEIGGTKVLAGVKLDVDEPMEDTPDRGNFIVSADLLPLAAERFETGPPSAESIEFARVVDRGIRAGNCADLTSLFIEEGKVWAIFLDLYVLNYDGNLFDAGTLAAMSALMSVKVPDYKDGAAIRTARTKPMKIDNIVASSTFSKIGSKIILDPTAEEELAADCRLTITTDEGKVRAMQKGMSGAFTKKEIDELVTVAFNKNKELKDILVKA